MEYYIENKLNKTINEYLKLSKGRATFLMNPLDKDSYLELEKL